jgi:hypothetical protein
MPYAAPIVVPAAFAIVPAVIATVKFAALATAATAAKGLDYTGGDSQQSAGENDEQS